MSSTINDTLVQISLTYLFQRGVKLEYLALYGRGIKGIFLTATGT
jgi:hypothetical protein